MTAISRETDLLRINANKKLDPKRKTSLGQFFTQAPICQFMASLFDKIEGEVRVLDAGCGVGSLFAAFTDEAINRSTVTSIQVDAFEIETIIKPYALQTLQTCKVKAFESGIAFTSNFSQNDFILTASKYSDNSMYSEKQEKYTHAILNPPYKKISNSSEHRKVMQKIGVETVNLYTAFMALAIKLIQPNGELVAIIPRSFCNGPYYQPFRELLLNETSLRQIHIFDSRDNAFAEDDVLQENIIIHCIKGGKTKEVLITSSPKADFFLEPESKKMTATDMTIRKVALDTIVKPADKKKFIHIATTGSEQAIVDRLNCFNHTLDDLGIQVSTGPVVDFRLSNDLRKNLENGAVPLLYPIHLNGSVHWPKDSKKSNAIMVTQQSRPWLWNNQGCFVITRRFSSKEEKRRIVATFYDSTLHGELIGFENKLNVFHSKKSGINCDLAKGLFIYLNSTLLDKYYRQFGGHTQVNSTDLRSLHYPSETILKKIGIQVNKFDLSQSEIDNLIETEINQMTEKSTFNPLEAQGKIEQALSVLTELGFPGNQLNERSALTLLSLLNLTPEKPWTEIERPKIGVTPIMDWCKEAYKKEYAPNTRETFRRQTLRQFIDSGVVLYNPDNPKRAVDSPKACYQISDELHVLLQTYGTKKWAKNLKGYLSKRKTLIEEYAMAGDMAMIPLEIEGKVLKLTAGDYSQLMYDIVKSFGPRFAPGAEVIYLGDTGRKIKHFNKKRLMELGITLDCHEKMPDVVLYYPDKDWLLLIESVTSHGPVNSIRHKELQQLFAPLKNKLVFVTAFPDRKTMVKYLTDISWETEVWIADAPSHMIHFNGDKFLDPHT